MMYRVVYASSAVELFTDAELRELLETSRRNNSAAGVTGMLLYKGGNFMQLLEGPQEAVETVLARIQRDPRHRGILKLLQEKCEDRDFGEWSMGFKLIDKQASLDLDGRSDFLDKPFDHEEFINNPSKCLSLLLNFKKNIR